MAGLEILSQHGPQRLTVDALCTRLGVTKGAFYHHFQGYDAYKTGLLQFFEQEGTLRIIEAVEQEATPLERLHRLLAIIVAYSEHHDAYEASIRGWAQHDADVRIVQARVDARRQAYVQGLLEAHTHDDARARLMTRLLYSLLLGAEHMHPPLVGSDLRALFDEFLTRYGLQPPAR